MGSSFGTLYGNQEMGNGDAEVHGSASKLEADNNSSQVIDVENSMQLFEAEISSLPSRPVNNRLHDLEQLNGKAKGVIKNVEDVMKMVENLQSAGDFKSPKSPMRNPVNQFLEIGEGVPEEIDGNAVAVELLNPLDGSVDEENKSLTRDKSEPGSSQDQADESMDYLKTELIIKEKAGKSKNNKPKTKGRKKTKSKLSPSRYFLRNVAIAKKQETLSKLSSAETTNKQQLGSSEICKEVSDNVVEILDDDNTPDFLNWIMKKCAAGSTNRSVGRSKKSGARNITNDTETNAKKSRSGSGKSKKRILKAKRRKPLDPAVEGEPLTLQDQMNKLEREVKIKTLITMKMNEAGRTAPKFHGLTAVFWQKIITCLSFSDLKNLRLVSPETNHLVEISIPWAISACFLFDAENPTWKEADNSVCPPELICEDNTLGWPDVRLKNIKNSFSVEKFWFSPDVLNSIKFLEIMDCQLSWRDYNNLLCGLKSLVEFSVILTEDFIRQNDVFVTLVGNLDSNYDIQQALKPKQTRSRKKNEASLFSPVCQVGTMIRKVFLSALNLEFTNILLAVLEHNVCKKLEELRIILSNDLFLNVPFHPDPTNFRVEKELRARCIIENNQETLHILQISFDRETSSRPPNPLLQTVFGPTLPMICNLLSPGYQKLSLKELIVELPINVPIHVADNAFWNFGLNDEKYQQSLKTLSEFCLSQTTLTRLRLSRINLSSEINIPYILVDVLKNSLICEFELGGKLHCDESNNCLPNWEKLKDVLVDVNVAYTIDLHALPYHRLISQSMPVMTKTQRFDLRSWAKDLRAFNIPILVTKFPNLTCLIIGDSRIRAEGLKNSPKIDDNDFQTILLQLPNLVELVIKCNMSRFTDFGLTGIAPSACRRMLNDNSFKRKPGDVEGYPLSNLKKLEVLELHGIGEAVTNVSAYLAFKDLPCLEELYLFSPKFSRLAKKLLKEKFRLRSGFKMIIN